LIVKDAPRVDAMQQAGHRACPGRLKPCLVIILKKVLACPSALSYYITKSPKHLDDSNSNQEIIMKLEISLKLAAFAIAMSINGVIIGSVAYLFDGKVHGEVASLVQATAPHAISARI